MYIHSDRLFSIRVSSQQFFSTYKPHFNIILWRKDNSRSKFLHILSMFVVDKDYFFVTSYQIVFLRTFCLRLLNQSLCSLLSQCMMIVIIFGVCLLRLCHIAIANCLLLNIVYRSITEFEGSDFFSTFRHIFAYYLVSIQSFWYKSLL